MYTRKVQSTRTPAVSSVEEHSDETKTDTALPAPIVWNGVWQLMKETIDSRDKNPQAKRQDIKERLGQALEMLQVVAQENAPLALSALTEHRALYWDLRARYKAIFVEDRAGFAYSLQTSTFNLGLPGTYTTGTDADIDTLFKTCLAELVSKVGGEADGDTKPDAPDPHLGANANSALESVFYGPTCLSPDLFALIHNYLPPLPGYRSSAVMDWHRGSLQVKTSPPYDWEKDTRDSYYQKRRARYVELAALGGLEPATQDRLRDPDYWLDASLAGTLFDQELSQSDPHRSSDPRGASGTSSRPVAPSGPVVPLPIADKSTIKNPLSAGHRSKCSVVLGGCQGDKSCHRAS